jgi:hypothetical protein
LGNFLIYRELDKKATGEKKMSISSTSSNNAAMLMANNSSNLGDTRRSFSMDSTTSVDRNKERQLVGSLSDSYRFKEDGLIKKTMSIIVNGVAQHLISYYDPNEVLQEKLRAPSSVPELASLEISPELLVKQNFRIPPLVEPTLDQHGHLGGQLTPPETSTSVSYDRRVMHPLRSMSVGSIRGHEQPQLMMRSDLMYHPYQQPPGQQRPPPSPNHSFQHPLSIPPNVYGNTNTTNMPSPSSMTSSPSTPMLSPSRYQQQQQQQQHQRHYSTSAVSSNTLPRFDPRAYTDNNNSNSNNTNSQQTSLGQIMSTSTVDYHQQHQQQQQQQQQHHHHHHHHQERFASPNLGQLLNPVHPLSNNNTTNNTNTNTSASSPSTPPTNSNPDSNANNSNNDILNSMGINHHHQYDYTTTSSSLRNSIGSQHENTNNNNTEDNRLSEGDATSNGTAGAGGGGGGGSGGLQDYMNLYQRPLTNTHQLHNNHFNLSNASTQHNNGLSSFSLGQDQDNTNVNLGHFMLK